jgi:hypothetical protein
MGFVALSVLLPSADERDALDDMRGEGRVPIVVWAFEALD